MITNTPHPPQQILVRVDCKERLPKDEGYYIATSEVNVTRKRFYDGIKFKGILKIVEWYEPATRIVLTVEEWEDMRKSVIEEVKEQLLKQMFFVTHENGYPTEAVPKATILSLHQLLNIHHP